MSIVGDPNAVDYVQRTRNFFNVGFDCGVMVILRGMGTASTLSAMDTAWKAGVTLIEVPINGGEGLAVLERSVAHADGRPVGAGTVLDPEMVRRVHDLGAAFTVAPDLDAAVVARAQDLGIAHLPGVSTPGEVARATRTGTRWLKAFPASVLTPAWITAMHGPFPTASFVATGGIDAGNAGQFLRAGARAVSLGSSIASMRPDDLLRCVSEIREALVLRSNATARPAPDQQKSRTI